MEKEPNRRLIQPTNKRDIERVHPNELMLAAKWWAANFVSMPPVDPMKVHLLAIPFAALLAPMPADLEAWLRHAHSSIVGATHATSIYEYARAELLMEQPPWHILIAHPEGVPTLLEHDKRWRREQRLEEMQRLLDGLRSGAGLGQINSVLA